MDEIDRSKRIGWFTRFRLLLRFYLFVHHPIQRLVHTSLELTRPLLLITPNCARKSVGKPVGKPLADLGCEPLSDGVSHGLPLLGCKLGKPIGNPVCEPLPQLVCDPLPNNAANDGPLLRRELA